MNLESYVGRLPIPWRHGMGLHPGNPLSSLRGGGQAGLGNKSRAIESYQRGLKLDAETGDPKVEALDWLAYAQFLDQNGVPPRLVLASVLKAEELLGPTPGPELDEVVKTRKELETKLGDQAGDIRRNAKTLAAEALAVKL